MAWIYLNPKHAFHWLRCASSRPRLCGLFVCLIIRGVECVQNNFYFIQICEKCLQNVSNRRGMCVKIFLDQRQCIAVGNMIRVCDLTEKSNNRSVFQIVIVQKEENLTSVRNIIERRTRASCNPQFGQVYTGKIMPICVVRTSDCVVYRGFLSGIGQQRE
ncbi:Hypothetical_protein [Hexamita inflata]|uniref:Hypothetical_protein n=1 Tax=Hexamita inflata TaxID=28002 RepID=A0AA86NGE3_9EUKA|nr:Hypothetical protein HINF_LOCUS6909 [Hexamita inflata]